MNSEKKHLFWVDGLKAFAIIGILLNHFVESFGSFPWFSNPSYSWPDFATRIMTIFPSDGPIWWRIVQFLGWLGDMGPGVFILVSGFTLTLSALQKDEKEIKIKSFYQSRLVRILPLYMVIHILVMISGEFLSEGSMNIASPSIFLSMLGLRFTDGLFFLLNPSWWFVWLIIQLYIVFPFLYKYLNHVGIRIFILITFGFTILSRLVGLLDITYSGNLYYWMTGLFFGSRLFEFTAGMVLARIFVDKQFLPDKIKTGKLLALSILIYIIGFASSLFYYTTLISNILITIGLCGLFLAAWKVIESYLPFLKRPVLWMGVAAFPVFLIHQPFFEWFGADFSGINKALILILILIFTFPLGRLLELFVNRIITKLPGIQKRTVSSVIIFSLLTQFLLNIVFFITKSHSVYKLDLIVFIINIFFIPLYVLLGNKITNQTLRTVLFSFLPVSVLFCFILTYNWFNIFWIFILIQFTGIMVVSLFIKKPLVRLIAPSFLVFILFLASELWLTKNYPVEVNRWGEYPALQKDSLTVYSLIPNKKTHLKYNNYDYYVKTNSLGFNGPDVNLSEKNTNETRILIIGDAFTMPEGIEYESAYPELLKAQLAERYSIKRIRVFNAGVTGYGPNEMLAQLNKYIDILKPDLFINQLFINEFEEINLNAEDRLQAIGFTKLSSREQLFSGSQIPNQVFFMLNKLLRTNYYLKYTYNKSFAYLYDRQSYIYSDTTIRKMSKYLRSVKLLCDRNKCKIILLYSPGQLEVSAPKDIDYYPGHIALEDTTKYDMGLPRNILKELCNEAHILFLDPVQVLKDHPEQPVYFKGSWHWNGEGHSTISLYLKDVIVNGKLIE